MDAEKKMTGFLIHGFAVAHGAAAFAFSQTIIGDEAILTALTVAMIISVARLNGAKWSHGEALAFLGIFIGTYVGTRGGALLLKWIPGIGNIANAGVSFLTTEALGWATYLFISKGLHNPEDLSKEDRKLLWREAKKMRNKERKNSEEAYTNMNTADKKEFERIMHLLRKSDLSDRERELCLDELEEIAAKYK